MSGICDDFIVFFNGNYIKTNDASINHNDRGFRYGDGVFETIRVNDGELFRLNSHLSRLQRGLKALKINADISNLDDVCHQLLKKNSIQSGFVRIAISRGVGSEGYMPKKDCKPTFLVQTLQMESSEVDAVDLWLSSYRKIPHICLPSDVKSAQGLNSTLARLEAKENECFEALLLSVDDKICEGSSGNIFWFKERKLYTPANNILKGVMREAVIEVSPYEVVEGDFVIDDIKAAEEVFVTNVAWVAKSVKSLRPLGLNWGKRDVCEQIRDLIL